MVVAWSAGRSRVGWMPSAVGVGGGGRIRPWRGLSKRIRPRCIGIDTTMTHVFPHRRRWGRHTPLSCHHTGGSKRRRRRQRRSIPKRGLRSRITAITMWLSVILRTRTSSRRECLGGVIILVRCEPGSLWEGWSRIGAGAGGTHGPG